MSVPPVTATRYRYLSFALVGLFYVVRPASAITVGVQAAGDNNPGGQVEVQVYLADGKGQVAGVQADIAWDATCLSVVRGNGNAADCTANAAIPKQLKTGIRSTSTLRALYFSMSDVEPINQDAVLFTCKFTIDAATPATRCPVNLTGLILSDSRGTKLAGTTTNTVVQINQPDAPNVPVQAPAAAAGAAAGNAIGGAVGGAVGGAPAAAVGGAAGAAVGGAVGGAAGRAVGGADAADGGTAAGAGDALQAPAAAGAAGVAATGGSTPLVTPSTARTVAAATTPSPPAGTAAVSNKTPSPAATAKPGTQTPQSGAPGTPTPKAGTPAPKK